MSNSIPLNIGTLKDRKNRQEQADADLKLQILNSNRLARASRDYWINNETPVNTQPDYTTNEILNDKNKLLKILANDVKSLLDKEDYALFVADNTWNNLRYLRVVVQVFPIIKKSIQARLITAPQLLEIINTYIMNTDNDYTRGFNPVGADNENADYPDNANNNGDFDYEYNYDNQPRPRLPPGDRNPMGYDNVAGRQIRARNLFNNLPSGEGDDGGNNMEDNRERNQRQGEMGRVPEGYYVNADGEWIRIPQRRRDDMEESSGNYKGNQRRDDMESSREEREGRYYYNESSSSSSGTNNMRRDNSADTGRTTKEPDSQPSVDDFDLIPDPTDPAERTFDQRLLDQKIRQLESIESINELARIYSKLLYIQNSDHRFRPGTPAGTKRALKAIEDKRDEDYPNATPEENTPLMQQVARQLCAKKIDKLYRSGDYNFPEQPEKFNSKNFFGYGVKGKQRKGTKYGKGMAIQEMKGVSAPVKPDRSELYYSFGVFAVHKKSLGDNILNLKYKSFSQVHKYPKRQISDDLKDILVDAIETKKINNKLFNALTDSDKSFLTELVNEAKLKETFPNIFKSGNGIAVNENPLDRFEILKGELIAGNSSNEIKKELRALINQFMKQKLITAQEGFGILEML